jgi:hypothetical protein
MKTHCTDADLADRALARAAVDEINGFASQSISFWWRVISSSGGSASLAVEIDVVRQELTLRGADARGDRQLT